MNRLSKTALTLLVALAASGVASAADTQLAGCAAKRENIRSELRQAQEQGLSDKVAGLTRALDEVNAHCRDNVLVERHNKKVLKAQAKVNQTERSLRLAQEANKEPKKIAKLEGKLEKARAELAALQAQQP
jgi:DNA repair exonuclease SbcCD ATPase subunit